MNGKSIDYPIDLRLIKERGNRMGGSFRLFWLIPSLVRWGSLGKSLWMVLSGAVIEFTEIAAIAEMKRIGMAVEKSL